MQDYEWKTYG